MPPLSPDRIERFRRDGYCVARGVVTGAPLAALRGRLDAWIEESRSHNANWGHCQDGKARFDLEAGHSARRPA